MRGERLAERYELGDKLGEGGMGSVFAATHIVTGKRLAVKLMSPELPLTEDMVTRFRREARAAGVLDTEHIVQVFDSGVDDGKPYIAMELLEGESLSDLEERLGPLPVDLALRIVSQACAGVGLAHAEGVVHRDLKPSNLFVARVGERRVVKVLDFGIAKIDPRLRESTDEKDLTRTGTVLGSPHYISPEQVQAQGDVDARADVWALGIVLYEALCGRVPHAGARTLMEIMFRTYMQRPDPVSRHAPWVPRDVEEVLHGALSLSAGDRYADARDFGEALAMLLPDGHHLEPAMFVPLGDEERAVVAPRVPIDDATETDVSDAEQMRSQWAEQLGQRDTELPSEPSPPADERATVGEESDEGASDEGADDALTPPPSHPALWALVTIVVVAIGGVVAAWALGGDDELAEPSTDVIDMPAPEAREVASTASAAAEPERPPSTAPIHEPEPEPTAAPVSPRPPPMSAPPSPTQPAPAPPPSKGISKSLDEFAP